MTNRANDSLPLKQYYLVLLCSIVLQILKGVSLFKVYYRLSKRNEIRILQLIKLEKPVLKLMKLNLDVKYFNTCLDLNICPKFIKFRLPNFQVYKNSEELYQIVFNRKLKLTKSV